MALVWAVLLGATNEAPAQEKSVKPGINRSFQDPDVDSFVERFEGEDRAIYAYRHEIVHTLGLVQGMDVADVGAGTGFFSRIIAREVGSIGTVYAVDIADNFIKHIRKTSKEQGIENIEGVVCTERSVELPANSVDLVFICDTYHHFEYPYDTMASVHKALRPGGRLVIVDFERVKGVSLEWVLDHVRCGKGTVSDEVRDSGFDFIDEVDMMEGQYILQFRKREPAPSE